MPKPRSHIPLESWPQFDREAFQRAMEPARGLFEPSGLAAHWAEHTRISAIKGYGHWLHYLQRTGQLDPYASPTARASRAALAGYVHDLRSRRLAPATVAGRVRDLSEVLRVIEPSGDRELVQRVANSTRTRISTRDKRERLVAPRQLYEAGITRMERNRANAALSKVAAVQYCDGLMMAMLAAKPVRRKNLVGMRIGKHLAKASSGHYELRFAAHETKTKQAIMADLPASLTAHIDYWLDTVRSLLLGDAQSSAVWVTMNGTDMAQDTAYVRFCRATREELGVRINPHLTRDIAATGIAIAMPDEVRIIPMVLDHRSDQTSNRHYNLADTLSASARYLDVVQVLRCRSTKKG